MTSPRVATAVIILAAVALVPTVVHNYLGLDVPDGYEAAAWLPTAASHPVPVRGVGWFRDNFGAFDAADREVTVGGSPVRVSIVRSFDAKRLYHHPENVIAYGRALHQHSVISIDALPGVPVHRLQADPGSDPVVALYVLWWNGQFVDSPYVFQIGQLTASLVSGRSAATLIFVQPVRGATEKLLAETLTDVVRRLPAAVTK